MKKFIFILSTLIFAFFITACNEEETGSGTLILSISDSPIDTAKLSGVYITITEIQVHTSDSGWQTIETFSGPEKFNLLDLTRGVSDLLGSIELKAGNYTQVRFLLDAPAEGTPKPTNPGCYIEFKDGSTQALFVPSGSESGFKGTGNFRVPLNGTVEVTADFDARKSVHKTGSVAPRYILIPVIRLIVENQAGAIRGNVTNIPADTGIVIFAYTNGTYNNEEDNDPLSSSGYRFPNAISSDKADSTGVYHISYLAEGTYDLVVASFTANGFAGVLGLIEDVSVVSNKTTKQDIDISLLK